MTAREIVERLLSDAVDPKRILRQISAPRLPQPDEVEYDLEAEWEQEDPEGHFSDPQDVEFVRQQIEQDNIWGWCSTHVIARWLDQEGNEWTGDDWLGGCSYESEASFKQPDGYYDDMKAEAYSRLVAKLEKAGYR